MNIDLYVIVERGMFESDLKWLSVLQCLAELEVPGLALQVRTKQCPGADHESLARRAATCTLGSPVPVLLNGSEELATSLGFAGVHWPEALIPPGVTPATGLRGASVHSQAATARATQSGAQFLVVGPVFDAGSKPVKGTGEGVLTAISASSSLPVLAVGGIQPGNVAVCLRAGASGIAVVTGVILAGLPQAAVRAYRQAIDGARLRFPEPAIEL